MQLVHFMIIISCSPGTENAEVRRSFNAAALPISPAENKLLSCFKLNTLVNQILPKHFGQFCWKWLFWMHQSSSWSGLYVVIFAEVLWPKRIGQEGRSHHQPQERPGPEDWQDDQIANVCTLLINLIWFLWWIFALLRYLKNTDQEIGSSQSGPCSCNCFLRKLGCCWLCPCLSQAPR